MNVFDLFAKITLDSSEYDSGLDSAEAKSEGFGSKLKSGLATAAKVGASAVGIAAAAIVKFTKDSVGAYAEYEQLVGGVQKLYGNMGMSVEQYAEYTGKAVEDIQGDWQKLENAQNIVMENARQAYRTSGMDMNTYMETATSFSAALINSLGGDTVKAAEQTDVAMRAISDNFNTFGGDIQNVQNAYQGFAKQNYTMLDNLKLGYGGTKTEMERLINDAEKVDSSFKAQRDSSGKLVMGFNDIVTAIDLIQQKQGIAGTTAREASTTIAGSLGMVKAAWQNLVIGVTDGNADLDRLIDNLVDSVIGYTDEAGEHVNGFLDNLIPVATQAVSGVTRIIEGMAPMISKLLPTLVSTLLPAAVNVVTTLLTGVASALPTIIQVLIQQIPPALSQIASAIIEALPGLVDVGRQAVTQLSSGFDPIVMIEKIGEILTSLVDYIIEWIPALLDQGIAMVDEMSAGLAENGPAAIEAIGSILGDLITKIIDNLPEFLENGIRLIASLAEGLIRNLPAIIGAIAQIIGQLIAYILRSMPQFLSSGLQMIASIASGLLNAQSRLWSAIAGIIRQAINKFKSTDWGSVGRNIIEGIANGVRNAAGKIADAAKSAAKKALDAAKSFLGIKSPSRVFREQIGKNISLGLAGGISGYAAEVEDAAEDLAELATDPFEELDSVTRHISADGMVSAAKTPRSDRDVLNRILEILEGLDLSNVGVYMDGKTLVGELVPAMDLAMGREASYKGRGVI